MGDMLKDFRGKITAETWCVIEAEHRATGKEHAAIVREILHGWAIQRLGIASMSVRLAEAEGLTEYRRELTGGSR